MSAETAAEQLRRLLRLVPHVADGERHRLADVAERAGLSVAGIVSDLQALVDRDEAPAGFVQGVQIYLEPDTVEVISSPFRRPMRLTRSELAALELGLAVLRAEAPPDERAPIDRARARLRETITRLPDDEQADVVRHAAFDGGGDLARLAELRRALRARRVVRLRYRGSGRDAADERRVHPYGLVFADGAWYLAAWCERGDGMRVFRLDRMEDATLTADRFTPRDDVAVDALLGAHGVFRAERPATMRVRYAPAIARWIAEREGRALDADGSLTLEHPVADTAWAVRHVLQYGPDARILEPAALRDAVRERLRALRDR